MQACGLKVGDGIINTLQNGVLRFFHIQVALDGLFHKVVRGALLGSRQRFQTIPIRGVQFERHGGRAWFYEDAGHGVTCYGEGDTILFPHATMYPGS